MNSSADADIDTRTSEDASSPTIAEQPNRLTTGQTWQNAWNPADFAVLEARSGDVPFDSIKLQVPLHLRWYLHRAGVATIKDIIQLPTSALQEPPRRVQEAIKTMLTEMQSELPLTIPPDHPLDNPQDDAASPKVTPSDFTLRFKEALASIDFSKAKAIENNGVHRQLDMQAQITRQCLEAMEYFQKQRNEIDLIQDELGHEIFLVPEEEYESQRYSDLINVYEAADMLLETFNELDPQPFIDYLTYLPRLQRGVRSDSPELRRISEYARNMREVVHRIEEHDFTWGS